MGTPRVASKRGGVLTFFRPFRFFLGVRVKGRKERAHDEGCVALSRVAPKRGGVLIFLWRFRFFVGVRVKGRKERAQNEGCVGTLERAHAEVAWGRPGSRRKGGAF